MAASPDMPNDVGRRTEDFGSHLGGAEENNMMRYSLTIVFVSLVTLFFFRSVLPRIPQLFLRGRLRVRRVGLRGIRGIEWRSQGFGTTTGRRLSTTGPKLERTDSLHGEEDGTTGAAHAGLGIKLRHVYLTFRCRAKEEDGTAQQHDRPREGDETLTDTAFNTGQQPSTSNAWITLHIDGVGVNLPKKTSQSEEARKEQRRERAKAEEDAQRQAMEEEESRLRELMESRPSSPRIGSSRPLSPVQTSSPMPAFSAAMGRMPRAQPDTTSTLRTMPFRTASWTIAFVRHTLVPAAIVVLLRICRALAYVVASLLPLLSNVLEVEVRKVEVYAAEQDGVLRLDRITLGAHMEVVPVRSKTSAKRKAEAWEESDRLSLRQRVSSALAFMPLRLGTGAREAMSLVFDGLPGLHANLRITTEGFQLFDAVRARELRTQRGSKSGASPHGKSDRSPGPSFAVRSMEGHEWRSFADMRPASASRARTNSAVDLFKETRAEHRSRWANRWTDWALEATPNADFMPHTAWDQGISACRDAPVAVNARLMAMQDVSSLKLGLVLGRSVSAKESLHLAVKLATVTVGADGLIGIAERLHDEKAQVARSKSFSQQTDERKRPQETKSLTRPSPRLTKLLENLGSISFALPAVLIDLSSKTSFAALANAEQESADSKTYLPSSLQMSTHLQGLHLSVRTSQVPDDMHQRWLGTCGIKNFRPGVAKKALSDGLRWTFGRRRAAYVEDRRVFAITASLSSVDIRLGIDAQSQEEKSEVLQMSDMTVNMRSTWTPAGLLLAATAPDEGAVRFFASDVNEQSLIADARLGSLSGGVKVQQLCALLTFLQYRKAERAEQRMRLGILTKSEEGARAPEETTNAAALHVPRFAIGLQSGRISYRLDASELALSDDSIASVSRPDLSLLVEVPSVSINVEGAYQDQYVRRSEAEKKAAWKSLAKDELEWSLSMGKRVNTSAVGSLAGRAYPKEVSGNYHDWRRGSLMEDERSSTPEDEPTRQPSKPMTMSEALREMQNIQAQEQDRGQPTKARRRVSANKQGMHALPTASHILKCNARCAFDSVNVFWAMDGNDVSSQRRSRDGETVSPSISFRLPPKSKAHRHILVLNDFELLTSIGVPGMQDLSTDVVTLLPEKRNLDVSLSLEELDLDMWHNASLDATRKLIQALNTASRKVEVSAQNEAFDIDTQTVNEEEASGAEHDQNFLSAPALIDVMRPDTSLYVSIGAIVAHIGGTDHRCDRNMSRGIGVDIKRCILQMAVAKVEPREVPDPLHYAMSARSALDLMEDQRATVEALAVRFSKAATAKLTLYELGVFPLLDAEQATAQHVGKSPPTAEPDAMAFEEALRSPSIIAPAVWEFQQTRPRTTSTHRAHAKFRQQDRSNFMIWMPHFSVRANLISKGLGADKVGKHVEELTIVTEDTRLLSLKVELLHTYCILVALASLKSLQPVAKTERRPKETGLRPNKQDQTNRAAEKRRGFALPAYHATLRIADVHIAVSLPNDVELFLSVQRIEASHSSSGDSSFGFEWLMGAVESPKVPSHGMWEEMARLRDCKIQMERPKEDTPAKIVVNADGLRLRVPFNYIVHPIIDNTVVALKTTKQLLHQFLRGFDDSVIIPIAEGPKHLPIITLNVRILALEAEDDPFETRLNIIWRSGGDENQARAERERAFEEKVQSVEHKRAQHNASRETLGTSTSTATSDSELEEDEKLSRQAEVPIEEARRRLHAFNASSWIRRFGNAKSEQARREELNRRRIYGRLPPTSGMHEDLPIRMARPSRASPLFRSSMSKVRLVVSPPSFPESHLRDFLYEQGKGTPKDMEYSLLVPINLHLRLGEWKIDLRDYPMPLLHFPPINRHKQPDTLAAVELKMDCCIAEQLGSHEAIRHLTAIVVPAATGRPDAIEYGISVPRMSMPTKFFGSPVININSSYTSRLVWGQSVQPAIHDVVRVFEGITSPPHDPSPKIGFWDKLSLILQGCLLFRFPGEGQFHVYLKGSRDPYHILGHGAGWVKCWRGDVELRVGFENAQQEVFQIVSDEYILAIPDLKDYIDRAATGTETHEILPDDDEAGHSQKERPTSNKAATVAPSLASAQHRYMREPEFKKICLKLTNGVRWGFGLLLERTCTDATCEHSKPCRGTPFYRECRFWTRKPHWQVYTRSKEFVETLPEDKRGDSFEGWRSHHLHFSVSIYSPADGLRKGKSASSVAVNNLYFTPLAWEHFWAWMRLFDSALSLPIRQGKLFPRSLEQSPKFGRHLGTMKYRFDIAPLFVSHLYAQEEKVDWARGRTTLLGIKSRMSSFHMDFHQRQQEMVSDRPELGGPRTKFHKPFYEAEVDLADLNFRTLAGQFQEPEKRLFPPQDLDENDDNEDSNIFGDENANIPDRDLEWYDLHDFVELDWAPPEGGKPPRIKLIEAMSCPRFNYYRRIESRAERGERTRGENGSTSSNDNDTAKLENTKFGHEKTHSCLVGQAPSPPQIQVSLAETRLRFLKDELARLDSKVGDEPTSDGFMGEGKARIEDERAHRSIDEMETDLQRKIKLVKDYISMLQDVEGVHGDQKEPEARAKTAEHIAPTPNLPYYSKEVVREWQAFDNRYFVHNPIIFYSNATREVLLKYYMSSRRRRGIVHSLSARAVRYIRNMAKSAYEESSKSRQGTHRTQSASTVKSENTASPESHSHDDSSKPVSPDGNDLLQGMLRDTVEYIMPQVDDEGDGNHETNGKAGATKDTFDPQEGISDEFEVRRSNVCVILKPQIVLRSLVDEKSTVIITAARTRLHNYAVKDPRVEEDSVNERVLYRNFIGIDALQGFHPSKRCTFTFKARERFGFVYVPLETLVDMRYETSDFDRIAPRTDATVQYDKFNKLRLNDPSHPVAAQLPADGQDSSYSSATDHLRHTMDLIRLRCPRYTISANADQFGAIYNVVTDLLLYRDPAYREHAKKLEIIMFSFDLTDIDALADVVQALQVRTRHARELHAQYQLHFDHLNDQGRLDFLSLKAELNDMQEELNLLLEAITQTDDNSDKEKKSALRLDAQAQDVGWNMMGNTEGELLAKLSIRGASFTWLNKADNSVANNLSVVDLNAVNVDPNAVFQEIISKYSNVDYHPMKEKGMLLNAAWSVLAPVGGIAIVDHFELHLHPLRIQIERRIGRQIEEYIFGSMREKRREREEQEQMQRISEQGNSAEQNGKSGRKRTVSMRLRRLKDAVTGHGSKVNQEKEDTPTDSSTPPSPRSATKAVPPARRSIDGRRSMTLHRASSRTLMTDDGRSGRSYPGSSAASTFGNSTAGGSSTALNSGDNSGDGAHSDGDSEEESGQRAIASRNAVEMRERASRNVTFVSVKVSQTIFCLSYKSEKQKSIMDLYDLVFRSPRLEYRNRTWAHADLASHLKRDIIKAAWKQKSTLIKGVISQRRPHASQRVAQAALTLTRSRHSPSQSITAISPSPSSESGKGPSGVREEKRNVAHEGRDRDTEILESRSSDAPEFRLLVDPPSFSTSGSQGSLDGQRSSNRPHESQEEAPQISMPSDSDEDSSNDSDADSSREGSIIHELSDVGEEAESPYEMQERRSSQSSADQHNYHGYRAGEEVSRRSSKGSHATSHHPVPGAAALASSQQKLGKLLAKTLQKRRAGTSPDPSSSSAGKETSETHSSQKSSLENHEG